MNRFKSLCLVLCSLLLCLSGFSPVVSYAYETHTNFYPVDLVDTRMQIRQYGSSGYSVCYDNSIEFLNNKYYVNNPGFEDIESLVWYQHDFDSSDNDYTWTFPYNPDVYDYYLIGTVTGFTDGKNEDFTFKPTGINVGYYDVDRECEDYHTISNLHIFDVDSEKYLGYSFSMRIHFGYANNLGIKFVYFKNDKDLFGSIPENLVIELGIMAVSKDDSETVVLQQILEQLNGMESSIIGSINDAADNISGTISDGVDSLRDSINEQYAVEEKEDFGVTDIVNQVEQKAGVLAVGTTTLVNFLDLFDSSNAGSTQLTFPGFSMQIQGTSYQIWNDVHYDLSELDTHFGGLMEVVRWATTMVVYMAVLNYLVHAFDEIFGSK